MRFTGPAAPFEVVENSFQEMRDSLADADPVVLKEMMKALIPEYQVFEGSAESCSPGPSLPDASEPSC